MNISGMVLGLIGGLGLFLYGMTLMSDSLEKAAGAKLRGVLELFTKNRYVGIIVGVVFTAIIQSSSAATVMVVSFVNAGLMTLYQAIGVIYVLTLVRPLHHSLFRLICLSMRRYLLWQAF